MKYRERLIRIDLLIINDVGLKKLPPEIAIDLHDLLALDSIVDKPANGTLLIKIEGPTMRKVNDRSAVVDSQSVPEEIAGQ